MFKLYYIISFTDFIILLVLYIKNIMFNQISQFHMSIRLYILVKNLYSH